LKKQAFRVQHEYKIQNKGGTKKCQHQQ